MLPALDEKCDTAAWLKMKAGMHRRRLDFEMLPTHLGATSATMSLYRAKVPGGWLLASRPTDCITFVPDPLHEWDGGSATD